MKNEFIECDGVSNMIDDGVEESGGKSMSDSEQGDESYTDSAKTTLKVRKQIGDGMGAVENDGKNMW